MNWTSRRVSRCAVVWDVVVSWVVSVGSNPNCAMLTVASITVAINSWISLESVSQCSYKQMVHYSSYLVG